MVGITVLRDPINVKNSSQSTTDANNSREFSDPSEFSDYCKGNDSIVTAEGGRDVEGRSGEKYDVK